MHHPRVLTQWPSGPITRRVSELLSPTVSTWTPGTPALSSSSASLSYYSLGHSSLSCTEHSPRGGSHTRRRDTRRVTRYGVGVLSERARQGRALNVRVATTAEIARLHRLDETRRQAQDAYDAEISRLYYEGVSTTSIGKALGMSASAVGNRIRNRERAFAEGRLPLRGRNRRRGPGWR